MKRAIVLITLLAFVLQIILPVSVFAQQKEHARITIAIMDFQNTSGNSKLDYLQQAIPEALITRLASSGKLSIVERSRLEDALKEMNLSFGGIVEQTTAVKVGKAVGANAILVGSFLEIGGLIRMNARLIDVETSKVLKAEVVQGTVGREIFQLVDDLAAGIEGELVAEWEPKKSEPEKKKEEQPPKVTEQKKPQQEPVVPAQTRVEKKGGSKAGWYILGAALVGGGVAAALLLSKKKEEGGGTEITSVSVDIIIPLNKR